MRLTANIFNGIMMKCFFGNDHIDDKMEDGRNYA